MDLPADLSLELVCLSGVLAVCYAEAWVVGRRGRPSRARPRRSSRLRCPYCHEDVPAEGLGPGLTSCAECGALHHAACWCEHAGCSVHACPRGSEASRAGNPVPDPRPSARARPTASP